MGERREEGGSRGIFSVWSDGIFWGFFLLIVRWFFVRGKQKGLMQEGFVLGFVFEEVKFKVIRLLLLIF